MQCFLCQKNNFKLVYNLKNKQIIECQNDVLYFSDKIRKNQNNSDKSEKLYGKKYYNLNPHPSSSNQKYFQNKLDFIKSQISLNSQKDLRILDVGCGWGDFLQVVKNSRIKHKGIDQSDEAIAICRSKGLNVEKILLQDLSRMDKNKYSAITFFQMIEHVTNPLPLLQTAKKLLKKNGIILITTPNNDSPLKKLFGKKWSVYQEPSHFVFYDKETLSKTLKSAGYKNIKTNIDSPRFLSLEYVCEKIFKLKIKNFKFIPVPTDPFGDLEAVAFNS